MKKLLLIIGFLFLISCSSVEESQQEKSKSQKQQDTPALNLRPIENLGNQESQKDSVRKPSHLKVGVVYESVSQHTIDSILSSVSRSRHKTDSVKVRGDYFEGTQVQMDSFFRARWIQNYSELKDKWSRDPPSFNHAKQDSLLSILASKIDSLDSVIESYSMH